MATPEQKRLQDKSRQMSQALTQARVRLRKARDLGTQDLTALQQAVEDAKVARENVRQEVRAANVKGGTASRQTYGGGFVRPEDIAERPTAPKDPVNLNIPIDVPKDSAGMPSTTGLTDDQIVKMDGGKFARYDAEIGAFTDVEFDAGRNAFVVPAGAAGPTQGQETLVQSIPALISMAKSFAAQYGDEEVLSRVTKIQRDLDAINSNTALDDDMRSDALLQLQVEARRLEERVRAQQVQQVKFDQQQRMQEAQARFATDLQNYSVKLEQALGELTVTQRGQASAQSADRRANSPASPTGQTEMQRQYEAYTKQTLEAQQKFDEFAAGGDYKTMGPTRPILMDYQNFMRARMKEFNVDADVQETILPLQQAYDRANLRRESLLEILSDDKFNQFVNSVTGLQKPDGTLTTRAEAIAMYNEQTAEQQMMLISVEAQMQKLSATIAREVEQGTIVNPGSANPITRREYDLLSDEEKVLARYEGSRPLTQQSVPVATKGRKDNRRVTQEAPKTDVGGLPTELPLTMMGRELEQGRKITMTSGYDVSIRALQKDPASFRRPLPGSEEEIVSQEDYDRYVQASELARGTSADLQRIGDALLTMYAQSGQRAQSRELEFQAENLGKENLKQAATDYIFQSPIEQGIRGLSRIGTQL
jgi:hypothetical protein